MKFLNYLFVVLLAFISFGVNAQGLRLIQLPFMPISDSDLPVGMEKQINAREYELFYINDLSSLESQWFNIKVKGANSDNQPFLEVQIPIGVGRFATIVSEIDPIMPTELRANFPEIHAFHGRVKERAGVVKWDVTPHGLHAMIMIPGESTIFIDPLFKNDNRYYIVYRRKDFITDKQRDCQLLTDLIKEDDKNNGVVKSYGSCELRTYRLALAATGEYTAFHGGTVALALAAQVTTINRINGIYEREMAVRMNLVPNNHIVIYTNSFSDPYTNNNGISMLSENQTNLSNVIGSANYDIGHVFSTGGGGVAGLGVVCNASNKGSGVTGSSSPIGDPFDVDYVAHEMGHQFACNHTFSNSNNGGCAANTNNATAMEPGSGSTIMAYAGICSPNNLQSNSDDYFHAISLQEMGAFITGGAHTCPVKTQLNNAAPVVSIQNTAISIPIGTPFFLESSASDANANDVLTYCWEQVDAGPTTGTPSATQTTKVNFRTFNPSISPIRYFPNLTSLAANGPYTWEVLPTVARTMNFRVVVRDNANGGGCNDFANMTVSTIASAGPFIVSYPSASGISWTGASSQTVTWDVANTTASPINASLVDILLSTDGGQTYNTTLASGIANDGSHDIIVPNTPSNSCRIMVKATGKNFFDISNNNFTIMAISIDYSLSLSTSTLNICQGSSGNTTVNVGSIGGYQDPVTLSIASAPNGLGAALSQAVVTPVGLCTLTITSTNNVVPGSYEISINATSNSGIKNVVLTLNLSASSPSAPLLTNPLNGATDAESSTLLSWNSSTGSGITYQVQVSENNAFTNLLIDQSALSVTSYPVSGLSNNTNYFWRVKALSSCGSSAWSNAFSFTTNSCNIYNATSLPILISSTGTPTITSSINIPAGFGSISSVSIPNISGNHTYISDLRFTLISPQGTAVILLNGACSDQDDFNLGFDAAAASSNVPCPPTSGLMYLPNQSLSAFDGQSPTGNWTLTVQDLFNQDGGSLNAWSIKICTLPVVVSGCTNPSACNYDISATQEDGSCTYSTTWYLDADADGYYVSTVSACSNPGAEYTGNVGVSGDCNDNAANINFGGIEICGNGVDDDCSGSDLVCAVPGCTNPSACNYNTSATQDDGSCTYSTTWYLDADADGYYVSTVSACSNPGAGYTATFGVSGDCNDNAASINTGGIEICGNGMDEDCSGSDAICGQTPTFSWINVPSIGFYGTGSQTTMTLHFAANTDYIESAGNGSDIWYQFTAAYNAVRIAVNGSTAVNDDHDIALYDFTYDTGVPLIPLKLENDVTIGAQGIATDAGSEVLLYDQLEVGSTYWVCIRNVNNVLGSPTLQLSYLRGSAMDIGPYTNYTNAYSSTCSNFKCAFRSGASNYTFKLWNGNIASGTESWSFSTTPVSAGVASTVCQLGKLVAPNIGGNPIQHTVKVDAHYSLKDAFGNVEPITGNGVIPGLFTMNAEADLNLRTTDRCPVYKSPLYGTLATNRSVCGTIQYQWELQMQSPSQGLPNLINGALGGSRTLPMNNIPGVQNNQLYGVQIRAKHVDGVTYSGFGSNQCMRTTGYAGMPINHENDPLFTNGDRLQIFPNPTLGSFQVFNANGNPMDEIWMLDVLGNAINIETELNTNGVQINTVDDLVPGVYLIKAKFGLEYQTTKVLIQ